ncbi:helix-turn-helix domain-containing protein [Rhizobium sp.]|uniref:helix-turn-helix domain-containing protein n=1 Tax=Rhizobium sp. TaxID=391 RepID=UPI0039175DDD
MKRVCRFRSSLRGLSTPSIDYLLKSRMTFAARALASHQMTMVKISADLGYNSEVAFGAAFKKVHGVSPGKYRDTKDASCQKPGTPILTIPKCRSRSIHALH